MREVQYVTVLYSVHKRAMCIMPIGMSVQYVLPMALTASPTLHLNIKRSVSCLEIINQRLALLLVISAATSNSMICIFVMINFCTCGNSLW